MVPASDKAVLVIGPGSIESRVTIGPRALGGARRGGEIGDRKEIAVESAGPISDVNYGAAKLRIG